MKISVGRGRGVKVGWRENWRLVYNHDLLIARIDQVRVNILVNLTEILKARAFCCNYRLLWQ